MDKLDYLESERKKLWERIENLEQQIKKKTSDYSDEAKQSSKKASEYRNKSEATKNQAAAILEEITQLATAAKNSEASAKDASTKLNEAHALILQVENIYSELSSNKANIEAKVAELDAIFEDIDSYNEKVSTIEVLHEKSSDISTKIEATYSQAFNRKKEIDQLYLLIHGYKEKDANTGEEKIIPGLKNELEETYDELKSNFLEFEKTEKRKFLDTLQAWKDEYKSVYDQIQELLPNALTAGLSSAYSQKKKDEVAENLILSKQFNYAVIGLVIVSLIPFGVSVYQIYQGTELKDALLQLPRLVLSILPLYIPVLWLAYSANKKVNLSKRLIEEYTHKEVLSKTFEGLAAQTAKIKDQKVSADLKIKLLYNILEVSSENPGKLISDYDKSDHPLMDVLDRSLKLSNSIDKLSKIPGMQRLSKYLNDQTEELQAKADEKATVGINKAISKT